MNTQKTVIESVRITNLENSTDTYLHGRWLIVARVVWITLVVFILGVFFAGLPTLYAQLERVCVGNDCLAEQLTPDTLRVLHNLGWSAINYASISLVFIVAEAGVWFIMGFVLAWRKSYDWFVLLVALMLVLLGTNNVMSLLATSLRSCNFHLNFAISFH